jgi:DNA-binding transcriptional ArsR family regulator
LCRRTRNLFTTVLEPYWPDIRANHHRELVRRGRLVADRGLRTALTATIPGSRWSGDCLEVDTPQERTVCLGGRGVVLTPVVFWTGPPLVGELGDQPVVLAYPAPAELTFRVGSESDTLAAIFGSTRAAVLRLLTDEHTTGDIARTLGISPTSASEHTSALRAARLVDSRRDGKAVVHHATGLGVDLLDVNRRKPGARFRPSPNRLHNAVAELQCRRQRVAGRGVVVVSDVVIVGWAERVDVGLRAELGRGASRCAGTARAATRREPCERVGRGASAAIFRVISTGGKLGATRLRGRVFVPQMGVG